MGSGKNTVIDIASGTAGGFAQVVAGHPLDTIKVRLQTQKPGPDGKFPFAGMADCAKKTFAKEGVKGLYKGAASPLVGAMAHNAGVFFSYGQAKALTGANEVGADLYKYFLAGAISAIPITLVETPVDLLKIKLQAQVGEGKSHAKGSSVDRSIQQRRDSLYIVVIIGFHMMINTTFVIIWMRD